MAAVWPGVVQYLLTTLPTLSGWSGVDVYDGPPNVAALPPDYATVAFVADDVAGGFTQMQNEDGWHVNEDGTVRFDISSQTGDSVLTDVRARAFALLDAFDAHLRKDQTLSGLLSANATVFLVSGEVQTLSNKSGVAISIVCTVAYYTETFVS